MKETRKPRSARKKGAAQHRPPRKNVTHKKARKNKKALSLLIAQALRKVDSFFGLALGPKAPFIFHY